jgi:hypothetical protein
MCVKVELGLEVCTIRYVVLLMVGVVFLFINSCVAKLWQPIFAVCTVLSVTCSQVIRFADYPCTIINC